QWDKFSGIQGTLDSIRWNPSEAKPAAYCIHRCFDRCDRQMTLRSRERLSLRAPRACSVHVYERVPKHIRTGYLPLQLVKGVIPSGHGDYPDLEYGMDEILA